MALFPMLVKVVPGRMSLLVILFLVIINVFNNVKQVFLNNFGSRERKREKVRNVAIPNPRSSAPAAASGRLNAIDRFKGWS